MGLLHGHVVLAILLLACGTAAKDRDHPEIRFYAGKRLASEDTGDALSGYQAGTRKPRLTAELTLTAARIRVPRPGGDAVYLQM